VRDISLYDNQYGPLPGDYYVEISLIGFPNAMLRGYFTIQLARSSKPGALR